MHLSDLIESGVSNWTVDPKLDDNEREMMSKFSGYQREMRHYTQKEKREIKNPEYSKRVSNVLSKSPVPFSLYFWQSTNPDYDKTSFQGLVNLEWISKYLGKEAATAIASQTSSDAVTIVITNNLSDENKVSLTSPWILAHRIVHAMLGDSRTDEGARIKNLMKSFLQKVLSVGYHCEWPSGETSHDAIMANEYHEIYGKLMGETIGTMKSARERKITNVYEWWYETVTQFLVTGRITFNDLPEKFDDGLMLTKDPTARHVVIKQWALLPLKLESAISAMLNNGKGQIFVV